MIIFDLWDKGEGVSIRLVRNWTKAIACTRNHVNGVYENMNPKNYVRTPTLEHNESALENGVEMCISKYHEQIHLTHYNLITSPSKWYQYHSQSTLSRQAVEIRNAHFA